MSGRREEILDAALELADERGLAAVSMRAVADRVGVTPMALYPHVGSKAALLDGMVGRLLGGMAAELAGTEGDWTERLSAYGRQARELAKRHPWGVGLLLTRPAVTSDAVTFVDAIYTALLEAGVPAPLVPRLERLISTFVLGFLASEANGRFAPGTLDPRGRRGQLPEGALPGHAAVAPWLDLAGDLDAEFEADQADLRQMIERIAADAATDKGAAAGAAAGPDSRTLPE